MIRYSDGNPTLQIKQAQELIRKGSLKILQLYITIGKIKAVLHKSISEWTSLGSLMESSNFVQTSQTKIDAILASNDDKADGVLKAFTRFRPGEKVVITRQRCK